MTDPEGTSSASSPLQGVSEDELTSLVDDVLRSGRHTTLPSAASAEDTSERLHRRVIADQMRQLASSLSGSAVAGEQARDQWYFEVHGKQMGPLSLKEARTLWHDGVLGPDSWCWHEGFSAWVVLSKVTELAAALAPKPDGGQVSTVPLVEEKPKDWKPAAAAMAQNFTPPSPPQPVPQSSAALASEQPAGVYYVLPSPAPAAPQATKRPLPWAQSVVTGVVAGLVMALALFFLLRGGSVLGPGASSQAGAASGQVQAPAGSPQQPPGAGSTVTTSTAATASGEATDLTAAGAVQGDATTGAATAQGDAAAGGATTGPAPGAGSAGLAGAAPPASAPSSQPATPGAPSPGNATGAPTGSVAAQATVASTSEPRPPPTGHTASADSDKAAASRTLRGRTTRTSAAEESSSDEGLSVEEPRTVVAKTSASPPATVVAAASTTAPASGQGGLATGEPPPEFGDDAFDRAFGTPAEKPRRPDIYIPPPPGEEVPETLSQAQVLQVVVANKAQVQRCIDEHRAQSQESGRLVMRWSVSTSGKVAEVEPVSPAHLTDSDLARCLEALIGDWSFPRHRQLSEPVVMPFAF